MRTVVLLLTAGLSLLVAVLGIAAIVFLFLVGFWLLACGCLPPG